MDDGTILSPIELLMLIKTHRQAMLAVKQFVVPWADVIRIPVRLTADADSTASACIRHAATWSRV
jgi:hypothetical protein